MISCIIPFHNERGRINKVLNPLLDAKDVDEIICVNDCSTDQKTENLAKKYQTVKFIDRKKRSGKSAAVKIGVEKAKGDIILLLDADLKNIKPGEIDIATAKMKNQPDLDMLILKEIYPYWTTKFSRHDILFSGKRLLKRKDLLKIFKLQKPKNYQLEMAINLYMIKKNKKVRFTDVDFRHTMRVNKIGFIKGTFSNLQMLKNIYDYVGLKDYFWQIVFFSHDRA